MSKILLADRDVVLAAVTRDRSQICLPHPKFRGDRVIALAGVTNKGMSLEKFNKNIRKDREVIIAAISQACEALKIETRILQDSGEAVNKDSQEKSRSVLQYANERQNEIWRYHDLDNFDLPPCR